MLSIEKSRVCFRVLEEMVRWMVGIQVSEFGESSFETSKVEIDESSLFEVF